MVDAGTKKMSVSSFGTFIKLMNVLCTETWVSLRDSSLTNMQQVQYAAYAENMQKICKICSLCKSCHQCANIQRDFADDGIL